MVNTQLMRSSPKGWVLTKYCEEYRRSHRHEQAAQCRGNSLTPTSNQGVCSLLLIRQVMESINNSIHQHINQDCQLAAWRLPALLSCTGRCYVQDHASSVACPSANDASLMQASSCSYPTTPTSGVGALSSVYASGVIGLRSAIWSAREVSGCTKSPLLLRPTNLLLPAPGAPAAAPYIPAAFLYTDEPEG